MATRDSYLIPHVDGVIKNKQNLKNYNFIYFIDGYDEDPSLGGGTGFYKDNEFRFPIFIPKTIKNSIVIYTKLKNFNMDLKLLNLQKIYIENSKFSDKACISN